MARLEDRIALVTGAASGIGRAIAQRLADDGARVLVTDIADDAGEETVKLIRANGGTAAYVHLDVTSEADWAAAVEEARRAFGGLDILVNNAGVGDLGTIEDTDLAQYEHTIAVTQTSVFLGLRAAGELLKQSGRGSVVNISSVFGASGGFGTSPAYHAAKGAVRLLTKNAALAWAQSGVRVNSVHPGFIATPGVLEHAATPVGEAMIGMTPMGRLGQPDEVAATVAFLASDDSTFVTGSELYVDGGYMAR
jgi:NAD(P)-dependent dehydrogenase (short-subunit alcohol dehydrogenase family)